MLLNLPMGFVRKSFISLIILVVLILLLLHFIGGAGEAFKGWAK